MRTPHGTVVCMGPDPKWLDVLKLPLTATSGVALATTILLALVWKDIFDFDPLGAYARLVLVVTAVVSWSFVFVGVIDYLFAPVRERRRQGVLSTRRAVRRTEQEDQRETQRTAVLARLDHLSTKEMHYVVEALREGSPTFFTYGRSPAVATLLGKGLVWTPGGTHHEDYYPFSFHDFVWEALREREDEFVAKDEERQRAEAAEKLAQQRRRY